VSPIEKYPIFSSSIRNDLNWCCSEDGSAVESQSLEHTLRVPSNEAGLLRVEMANEIWQSISVNVFRRCVTKR
jgi:hypothetical protein